MDEPLRRSVDDDEIDRALRRGLDAGRPLNLEARVVASIRALESHDVRMPRRSWRRRLAPALVGAAAIALVVWRGGSIETPTLPDVPQPVLVGADVLRPLSIPTLVEHAPGRMRSAPRVRRAAPVQTNERWDAALPLLETPEPLRVESLPHAGIAVDRLRMEPLELEPLSVEALD